MENKTQSEQTKIFVCNKCGYTTETPPIHKNATCINCGKGRLKIQAKCPVCDRWFSPDKYAAIYCSYTCKVKAQTTGRRTFRETDTKARSAQSLLAYHVKRGNIIRPTECEECGKHSEKIEGAHYNYDEPLNVRWLCRSCHVKWDKENPKGVTRVVILAARQATGKKAVRISGNND